MKKLSLFFMLTLSFSYMEGQELDHRMEFGVMAGVMTYTGDLNTGANLSFIGPAGGVFYRHNYVNNIVAVRFNVLVGEVSGNEQSSGNPLPSVEQRSFSALVTEMSAVFEYNFFDFRTMKPHQYYPICPYLFGGLGFGTVVGGDNPSFINIPLGVGVKFQVGDKLNLGVEMGARKCFTDKIDGVENANDYNSSSKQDWYYFTGLTFSYTRYYQKCPRNSPKLK
jgi:hypothetical protein